MSDSAERLAWLSRTAAAPPSAAPSVPGVSPPGPADEEGASAAFGYLRGVRDRALTIAVHRPAEGDTVTGPSSSLGPTRLHPSLGLRMLFTNSDLFLVTLRGRHLSLPVAEGLDLYERGIARHRVTWVREVPPEEARRLP